MSQRTEQEIMRNWKYMDPPLVSVCCITYNHEPYIRDAIEGFLMQETDFPFEVIIHDDASTDKTAEIVRVYAELYPKIIKPIFQTENKYSKGIKILPIIVWPKAQGEFIALCEGDDYWTDPRKLQIQIAEMKKHPDCDISFHPAKVKYMDKSRPDTVQGEHRQETCVIPLTEVIRGGGEFMPTNSIIIKREVWKVLPEWFYKEAPIGDFFLQIYGAKKAGALFISNNMVIYRTGISGSWSQRMQSFNYAYQATQRIITCLELAKKDFDLQGQKNLNYMISFFSLGMSIQCLKHHLFKQYKYFINLSWSYYCYQNKTQIFLYITKDITYLPYICIKVKQKLKLKYLRNL